MSVLMLQAFAGQRGSSGSAANQESAAAHIGRSPDQVADALESEHGVVNKEGDGIDAVVGIGRARRDERAHRAGFGDSFFEDLSILRFLVIKERSHIHGLIKLPNAGVDADLAEQGLHAESASFVGDDGHDQLAKLRIAQQLRQQTHENHGGGSFASVGAFVEFFKVRFWHRLQRRSTHLSLRHVSTELLPPRLHVLDLRAFVGGPIERRIVQFFVRNGNSEARTEKLQLVFI